MSDTFIRPKGMQHKTTIYFEFFVEEWNKLNKSYHNIADMIMDRYGIFVSEETLYRIKARHPHLFKEKTQDHISETKRNTRSEYMRLRYRRKKQITEIIGESPRRKF